LACATRTANTAPPFSDELTGEALELAETFALGRTFDIAAATQLLASLEESAADHDAQSAAIYALSAACKQDVDSPAWAAECAYNVRDAEAQASLSFSEYTSEVEAQLLQDPRVQQELRLQALDLQQLQQGVAVIQTVLARAQPSAA
jgi:hypothetical protein